MSAVQIVEYTDPACPYAWSAEPTRRRIDWLYGDQLSFTVRMVGLAENADEYEAKGETPDALARVMTRLAHAHHMPMDTAPRQRVALTVPACEAVVAVRLHAPEKERAMLRALRVLHFAGAMLDEPETLHRAAQRSGIDSAQLERWLQDPATEETLREDMRQARTPSSQAVALAHKLASTGDGGYRYTCPSYELRRDDGHVSVPGFQPTEAYEVALANLAPEFTRRDDPDDVVEVLRWAGEPLATAEVAVVCAIDLDEARQRLGRVATEEHIGFDGLWSAS